jgi:O-antigen/teichoic acid export membrane protein
MAAGARLQNEPERLGRAYFQIMAAIFVLVFPAFVFMALISPDLVRLLYGPQWSEAGWVLQILFLGMPFYVIFGLSTPVLWNTGRTYHESALQLPVLALGALGFYLLAGRGILAAAAVAAALLLVRALIIGATALRALQLSAAALLPHIGRGALLCALCALGALAGQRVTAPFDAPLLSLSASTLLAAGMLAGLVTVWPQLLGDQTTAMMIRFFPRLGALLEPAHSPMTLPDTVSEQRL